MGRFSYFYQPTFVRRWLSALRKDRDSNPRNGHPFTAFRVRRHRPLGHLSNRNQNVLSSAIDKQMPQLIIKCCKPHTNAANVPTKKLRFSFRTAKVLLFSELCKFFSCFLHFSSQFHLSRPSIMAGVLKNEAFCIWKFAHPKFLLYLCIRFPSYGILWLQWKQKQP